MVGGLWPSIGADVVEPDFLERVPFSAADLKKAARIFLTKRWRRGRPAAFETLVDAVFGGLRSER